MLKWLPVSDVTMASTGKTNATKQHVDQHRGAACPASSFWGSFKAFGLFSFWLHARLSGADLTLYIHLHCVAYIMPLFARRADTEIAQAQCRDALPAHSLSLTLGSLQTRGTGAENISLLRCCTGLPKALEAHLVLKAPRIGAENLQRCWMQAFPAQPTSRLAEHTASARRTARQSSKRVTAALKQKCLHLE